MGVLFVPLFILFIFIYALYKKIPGYNIFAVGVKEGFVNVFKIAPYLLTMFFAIDLFRRSGALNYLIFLLKPAFSLIEFPEGLIPMFLLKPMSGSASLSLFTDIVKIYGVDSLEGRSAAVMMGSTETIFYTLAVYAGSVGIKKSKYALLASIIAHITGCLFAVLICRYL